MNEKIKKVLIVIVLVFVSVIAYFLYNKDETILPINNKIENLSTEILEEGTGEPAKNGDEITVRYSVLYSNGKEFDSNFNNDKPFVFILGEGQLIKGWQEGMVGIKKGEKRRIKVPYRLAYGDKGMVLSSGDTALPPKTDLIFEVMVIDIK